jgi:L-lactate permease
VRGLFLIADGSLLAAKRPNRKRPVAVVRTIRLWLPYMRKITSRDWLALAVPTFVIAANGFVLAQKNGWLPSMVGAALTLAALVWFWRRQIRRHPQDTWRIRL